MGTWKPFVMGIAGILVGVILLVGVGYAANIFTIDKDGTVRLVITDSGNVGIGTTAPSALLSVTRDAVASDSPIMYVSANNTDRGIMMRNTGAHTLGNYPGFVSMYQTNATASFPPLAIKQWGIGNIFTAYSKSTGTDEIKFLVANNGSVGVGTTDPKTKLHVTGLPEYADNAAAIAAGLTAGAFYRTGEFLKVVY